MQIPIARCFDGAFNYAIDIIMWLYLTPRLSLMCYIYACKLVVKCAFKFNRYGRVPPTRSRTYPCDRHFLFINSLFSSSLSLCPYMIRFGIRPSSLEFPLNHSGSRVFFSGLWQPQIFDCNYTQKNGSKCISVIIKHIVILCWIF